MATLITGRADLHASALPGPSPPDSAFGASARRIRLDRPGSVDHDQLHEYAEPGKSMRTTTR